MEDPDAPSSTVPHDFVRHDPAPSASDFALSMRGAADALPKPDRRRMPAGTSNDEVRHSRLPAELTGYTASRSVARSSERYRPDPASSGAESSARSACNGATVRYACRHSRRYPDEARRSPDGESPQCANRISLPKPSRNKGMPPDRSERARSRVFRLRFKERSAPEAPRLRRCPPS